MRTPEAGFLGGVAAMRGGRLPVGLITFLELTLVAALLLIGD